MFCVSMFNTCALPYAPDSVMLSLIFMCPAGMVPSLFAPHCTIGQLTTTCVGVTVTLPSDSAAKTSSSEPSMVADVESFHSTTLTRHKGLYFESTGIESTTCG